MPNAEGGADRYRRTASGRRPRHGYFPVHILEVSISICGVFVTSGKTADLDPVLCGETYCDLYLAGSSRERFASRMAVVSTGSSISIVQVGHKLADRYIYLPFFGF